MTQAEYDTTLAYLTTHYGPLRINTAALPELRDAGFTEAEAAALVAARQKRVFRSAVDLAAVPGLTAERLTILDISLSFESEPPPTKSED